MLVVAIAVNAVRKLPTRAVETAIAELASTGFSEAGTPTRRMSRLSGHRVDVAFDGASGLGLIAQLRPQVVLCHIGLPGMDGCEVGRQMRPRGLLPAPTTALGRWRRASTTI